MSPGKDHNPMPTRINAIHWGVVHLSLIAVSTRCSALSTLSTADSILSAASSSIIPALTKCRACPTHLQPEIVHEKILPSVYSHRHLSEEALTDGFYLKTRVTISDV